MRAISFAAPLRPDTEITVDGKYEPSELAIGSGGNYSATFGFDPHLALSQVFGERGSRLYLALDPSEFQGLPATQIKVCDVQEMAWNPADLQPHRDLRRLAARPADNRLQPALYRLSGPLPKTGDC